MRSAVAFDGALRQAIHGYKYEYMRALARDLGDMLVAFWEEHALPADTLIPVPLHVRRLRERGYNQSQLLAEHLGRSVGVPVESRALRRHRYTLSQTHLDAGERQRNVAGAFSCADGSVAGKRIVLIDDVCTTGSTLEACSVVLRAGGARSVWALTLARAMDLKDVHGGAGSLESA